MTHFGRRRFIAICAAAACLPRGSVAATWRGQALGAEVSLTLHGAPEGTIEAARDLLGQVERRFSLYDPGSELSRLNRAGVLHRPSTMFRELLYFVDEAYRLTEGRFDPTVGGLWTALAQGGDIAAAARAVGWARVERAADGAIRLAPGQALSFNGIAQGFATDLVADALRRRGLTRALVDIGEFAAIGGPFRLGLADPVHGMLGRATLHDGAIATSSPQALRLGRDDSRGHILHPRFAAEWSTVSVEADRAVMADALSTGLCLGDADLARRTRAAAGIGRVRLVDTAGDLVTI
ncbi:FAD:protein FMN transferase [Roseobacter sp. HKCCA0434]|uniref:FAD:protein FMN transferase n=1 Tax=Roseobacter sp. HKCCA0434 TaxID=3079297 RepID=UPI002905AC09|nr:FAD:protein FMN transferase [Roseobacter sp. HKCCA0434]